jgi:NTP pyrophosphatase (non-canonical NTP hydrolase)
MGSGQVQLHFHGEDVHRRDGNAYVSLVHLSEFQARIKATYAERDSRRGVTSAVAWLTEELGELAQAARKGTPDEQRHEVGDVLAWLASLATQLGVDLEDAAARYAVGCPVCGRMPCGCAEGRTLSG